MPDAVSCPYAVVVILVPSQAAACDTTDKKRSTPFPSPSTGTQGLNMIRCWSVVWRQRLLEIQDYAPSQIRQLRYAFRCLLFSFEHLVPISFNVTWYFPLLTWNHSSVMLRLVCTWNILYSPFFIFVGRFFPIALFRFRTSQSLYCSLAVSSITRNRCCLGRIWSHILFVGCNLTFSRKFFHSQTEINYM